QSIVRNSDERSVRNAVTKLSSSEGLCKGIVGAVIGGNHGTPRAVAASEAEHINAFGRVERATGGPPGAGSNLNSPLGLKNAAEQDAVLVILGRRAQVAGPEQVGRVGGRIAEGRRTTGISQRAGADIVAVDGEMLRHTAAIGQVERVIARTANRRLDDD